MQLTQRRLGIGILAIIAFVMLALTQTANADTSYRYDDSEHDRNRSSEDKDRRCDEGYWKADGSWHAGMDGKSDNGYWDDGCWRDTPRDQDKQDKDRRTDEDCWRDDSSDHSHEQSYDRDGDRYSWNGRDGTGKDGNGREYTDGHKDKYHSSAFSSVRSYINAHSDVRVSLR